MERLRMAISRHKSLDAFRHTAKPRRASIPANMQVCIVIKINKHCRSCDRDSVYVYHTRGAVRYTKCDHCGQTGKQVARFA